MTTQTFAERCQIAQQLLPDAQYRVMLTKLHDEMLQALAEQPAQQEPVAWNVIDPLGKVVATETNAVRGWARIAGYKPTVEGLLGFHEQGWRVVPTSPQPPAQQDLPDLIAGALGVSRGTAYDMMREALAEASPPDPCCWPGTSCGAQQEPVAWADECRIELVNAIHFLASDFENALGAFGGDIEARRKAEGDIAHARSVASRWNWNGTSPQAQPAREWVNLTVDELIDLEHKHLRHEDLVQAIEAKLKEKNT